MKNQEITFKKLDSNTYYVEFKNHAINMYARYSECNKHYAIDIGNFYFEEKTIKKVKEKVLSYILQGKLFNSLFEL